MASQALTLAGAVGLQGSAAPALLCQPSRPAQPARPAQAGRRPAPSTSSGAGWHRGGRGGGGAASHTILEVSAAAARLLPPLHDTSLFCGNCVSNMGSQWQPSSSSGSSRQAAAPRRAASVRAARRQRLVRPAVASEAATAAAAGTVAVLADLPEAGTRAAGRVEAAPRGSQQRLQRPAPRGSSAPRRRRQLSAQEEQALAELVAGGGPEGEAAVVQLADANVPLVYHLARRYVGRGLAIEVSVSYCCWARGGKELGELV